MSIFAGLLIIAGMTFVISMLVAFIFWALSLLTAPKEMVLTGVKKPAPFARHLMVEWQHFRSFQKHYRTYWHNENAASNELIDFYHE